MLHEGNIALDVAGEMRAGLEVPDLLAYSAVGKAANSTMMPFW